MPDFSRQQKVGSEQTSGSGGGFMRTGSGTATPPTPPSEARATLWSLTGRDKRKYARLFSRISDGGFVSADVARDLMERSELPMRSLAVVWEHSDRDGDGRLSWKEFVVMTHLITRCKKVPACTLPDLNEALPAELELLFSGQIESPQELAAIRSPASPHTLSPKSLPRSPARSPPRTRSPSRSPPGSKGNSLQTSPVVGAAEMRSGLDSLPLDQEQWSSLPPAPPPQSSEQSSAPPFDAPAFATEFKTEFQTDFQTMPQDFGSSFAPAFGFGEGFTEDQQKEKKKKKHKDKKSKDEFGSDTGGDAAGRDDDFRSSVGFRAGGFQDGDHLAQLAEDIRLAEDNPNRLQNTSKAVARHLEAIIDSDADVTRLLQKEIIKLEDSFAKIRRQISEVESDVHTLKREGDREVAKRDESQRQTQNAKYKLEDLQADCRSCNIEYISLQRDLDHLRGEMHFMKRQIAEEEKSLDALQHANLYLEKSCKGLELHSSQLIRNQREAAADLAAERELVRQEERNNAEVRNHLERKKREYTATVTEQYEARQRQRQLLEMEGWKGASARLPLQYDAAIHAPRRDPQPAAGVNQAQHLPPRGTQPGGPREDRRSPARVREQSPPLEALRHNPGQSATPSWMAGSAERQPMSRQKAETLRTTESDRGRWSTEPHSWASSLGTDSQKTQVPSMSSGPRSPLPSSLLSREGV
eukprot:gnl/MRDRNA2_/MRDRNA2_110083_c0_seq1.p1 gnl/MRDRNA2_/MRDRNA2_110083_c0~~gnl/MRDRNA2_/MRDRNA2_110083_c0_seq1.p1  ORF type:complete len:816 (-),score=161.65 gnl/MRDRNA2_/MRDRNA2_110083_c0_seq1:58-2151(-)